MAVAVGERLGAYVLEALTGRGSMADVYRARHFQTGEIVAIKIIHAHLLGQRSLTSRFQREAEMMASLRHPHIARVLAYEFHDDLAYLVMEFLGGGTLEQRLAETTIRRQSIPLNQALGWMQAICSAVDEAHSHGLIHRDLKPANILFRGDNDPVLTDFGLAHMMDAPRMSGSNAITGTPAYLSPEQARGLSGDRRSDVYSLGVILYEILAGQTPFQGSTISVAMKHISELPPSPRLAGRYLPPGVEAVMMRTLSKDPAERYQSARALADAFGAAVERVIASEAPTGAGKTDEAAGGGLAVGAASAARPAAEAASAAGAASAKPAAAPGAARPASVTQAMGRIPVAPPARAWSESESVPVYVPPAQAPLFSPQLNVRSLISLAVMFAIFGILGWWAFSQMSSGEGPASAARFSAGSQVRVVVPGQTSVSVLRNCPPGAWLGVLAVASDGDTGVVTGRQTCGSKWWYEVNFPQLANGEWNGRGWLPGDNLTTR